MTIRRMNNTHADPFTAIFETAVPLSVLPALIVPAPVALGSFTPAVEIWIGYSGSRWCYLDKQVKAPNTEQQIHALRAYYEDKFTTLERAVRHWIYCQVPIVQVGKVLVPFVKAVNGHGDLPRPVEIDQLEKHGALSTGFIRPETLRDGGRMFHDTDTFDVSSVSAVRSVLCIGYALDKKLLIWPLALTMFVAATVTTVAGRATHNVATGAAVGSLVGGLLGLIWAYVMWLFS